MRATVIAGPGKVELTTVDDPAPGPREAVIQVAACRLVGTDPHIRQGKHAPSLPIVPGHEFAGDLIAVGSRVTQLTVGTEVAADPNLYCSECHYRRLGRNNPCERYAAIGVTHPGAAAEFVAAPVANHTVLPDGVRTEDAAPTKPLSCEVHGYDVLRSRLGLPRIRQRRRNHRADDAPAHQGHQRRPIDVVGLNAERLTTALRLGCPAYAMSADELERPRHSWDVVIDATGNAQAIQNALGRVGKHGIHQRFGVASPAARATIEPYRIYNEEITITGSMAVPHSFEAPRTSSPPASSTRTSSSPTPAPPTRNSRP